MIYIQQIESEKNEIDSINRQIARYESIIADQNGKLGGIKAIEVNDNLINGQLKVFEDRIDHCSKIKSDIQLENKTLREQIDSFRQDRVIFDKTYRNLEVELRDKKIEIELLIKDSPEIIKEKDKSLSYIHSLQSNAEYAKNEFERELKDLGDLIKAHQHSKQLHEPISLKNVPDRNKSQQIQISSAKTASSVEGTSSSATYQSSTSDTGSLLDYESAIQRILLLTETSSIDDLIRRFQEFENQNFSLFTNVNNVNTDIEKLERKLDQMRDRIDHQKGRGLNSDAVRKRRVFEVEEKLKSILQKTSDSDRKCQESAKVVEALNSGVQNILARIGTWECQSAYLSSYVTDSNVLECLGVIEQKTNEILHAYAASQVGTIDGSTLQLPHLTMIATGSGSVSGQEVDKSFRGTFVKPAQFPGVVTDTGYDDCEESEDADGGQRPFTRAELENFVMKDLGLTI